MEEKKPKSLAGELSSGDKYQHTTAPGMPRAMQNSLNAQQTNLNESMKEFERLKKKLEDFKKKILKKYKFARVLTILPKNALPMFAEDEGMPVEVEKTNPILLMMVMPEEEYKNLAKIKPDVVSLAKETGENIWVMIKTEVDLWNYGLDSKFEFLDAVASSFPIHDNGFLGVLRLASIHKNLVLRKFEKYVASYVIAGSLVRGVADKDSDVDTFVIIDDTDVKRMPRLELLEKLRGIIYDYIKEANALSGVNNVLNVQVYLLTDFWQSVKDAHPVMFTFIRDGIPMYDRGTFIPWKLLLKMGKIKPSPEAVDMFMKSGDQTDGLVKRRMIDAMIDIYWGIVTPTQALMMLTANAPPEPKAIVSEVKKVLVDKEKLMDEKELKFLEKIVKIYKDYEHGKLNEISGKEVDELKKGSDEYVKKMKDLRKKIEVRMQEHGAENITQDVFSLLKIIFGAKSQEELIKDLEKELVKKGKIKKRMLEIAKEISTIKAKAKKVSQAEMQKITGDSTELISALLEYAQRKELVNVQKGIIQIISEGKRAEVVYTDAGVYVVEFDKIRKIENGQLVKSERKKFEEDLGRTENKTNATFTSEVFDVLRKEFGKFSVSL